MSPAGNPLRRALAAGAPTIGAWCGFPTAMSGEILGQLGFDWVCVDRQHGGMNPETAAAMLQAISLTGAVPVARVAYNAPWLIGETLDMGAFGIIVPTIDSAAEAAAAARACRYPPLGARSDGAIRVAACFGSDVQGWNEHVLCFVMIETRGAWEELEAICAVPGVDGIYVGPNDLAHSLGRPASFGSLTDADVARLIKATTDAGITAGIHTGSGAAAQQRIDQGFRFVAVASDTGLLASAATRELSDVTHVRDRGAQPIDHSVLLRADSGYGGSTSDD